MAPATGTRRRVTGTASEAVADLGCEQPLDLESTLFSAQVFRWRRVGGWYQGVVCDNIVTLRRIAGGLQFAARPLRRGLHRAAAGRLPEPRHGLAASLRLHRLGLSPGVGHRPLPGHARAQAGPLGVPDVLHLHPRFQHPPHHRKHRVYLSGCSGVRWEPPVQRDMVSQRRRIWQPVASPGCRDLGLGYRAAYLAAAARTVAAGDVDLYALREAPYEVALEVLTSLYGVGDKVANCVLLFALDKPEAFPVDTHIAKRLREWYPACARLKPAEMRAWAQDCFGPYAGYANHYLFHDRRLERRRQRSFPVAKAQQKVSARRSLVSQPVQERLGVGTCGAQKSRRVRRKIAGG